jgi:two-component system nitrogen regulation response regulator NtrX
MATDSSPVSKHVILAFSAPCSSYLPVPSIIYLGCPSSERADTEQALAAAGVLVVWADTVASALTELQQHDVPVLLDLSRGAVALQNAREIRSQRAATLMFAVVDVRRPDLTTEAVLSGMADVFTRPLGGRHVANAIQRERSYETRTRPPDKPEPSGEHLYCHSSVMRDVSGLISRAATVRAGVLIRGEEGTGRQLVARSIHAAQAASPGAFVAVDCASYESERLDAALFGSIGRSHSGDAAHGLERVTRDSLLYQADGGTMYLQNLAEAPTRVQLRLGQVLRDREAVLAETRQTIALDVRPMVAADPGIEETVREGRVREDLFRRLSAIRIEVPSLRNRRDDIPALANSFVREVCARRGVPPKTLSRPALALIVALPWRGNAIELHTLIENVVESLGGGRGISLEDVLMHVRLDGGAVVSANGGTLRQARSRFEREYIATVLDQHHGHITEAAKALGIQRTNLYRKMRSLKVSRGTRHRTGH